MSYHRSKIQGAGAIAAASPGRLVPRARFGSLPGPLGAITRPGSSFTNKCSVVGPDGVCIKMLDTRQRPPDGAGGPLSPTGRFTAVAPVLTLHGAAWSPVQTSPGTRPIVIGGGQPPKFPTRPAYPGSRPPRPPKTGQPGGRPPPPGYQPPPEPAPPPVVTDGATLQPVVSGIGTGTSMDPVVEDLPLEEETLEPVVAAPPKKSNLKLYLLLGGAAVAAYYLFRKKSQGAP